LFRIKVQKYGFFGLTAAIIWEQNA
jgi:hypothetical protein